MNVFTHVLVCFVMILGGCGSSAFQSIGGLLESSSQESAATAEAPRVERHSASQVTTCQQTKQHETFTAEASHTYTQQATKMPDVRMLWVVDTSTSMRDDILPLASGLVSFVNRVADLTHIRVHLLVKKSNLLSYIKYSGTSFPALSQQFFAELPPSIEHFDVMIDSHNSLNRSFDHLQNFRPNFWPQNSPKIIKALVVATDDVVHDGVHHKRGTKGVDPGFVSFIKETKRAAGFHLFGFVDRGYDTQSYQNTQSLNRVMSVHQYVSYQYYIEKLGGRLFHVFKSTNTNNIPPPPLIDWDTAFEELYDSIHVEIKKIAPNVVQTQCAIMKVQSVSINNKQLDSSKFTIEADERLVKISTPLAKGDTIDIYYETSAQE